MQAYLIKYIIKNVKKVAAVVANNRSEAQDMLTKIEPDGVIYIDICEEMPHGTVVPVVYH